MHKIEQNSSPALVTLQNQMIVTAFLSPIHAHIELTLNTHEANDPKA